MLILHIDQNFAAFRPESLRKMFRRAAELGYDTILWELENKVRFKTAPETADPDALSVNEFRELLLDARETGLKSIPLLQTIGHAEYILSHHPELRENGTPDCYCTENPMVTEFLNRRMEEIVDCFDQPEFFHLGGDEAWNFATCPVCRRKKREELYARHLTGLCKQLEKRGIRPGIWSDMVLNEPDTLPLLPRNLLIWVWNYHSTNGFPESKIIAENGFEQIVCPSASSAGDSPFLPHWDHHAQNIAGAAKQVREQHLAGCCVTSWSIRMGRKKDQEPLLEIAPEILKNGKEPEEAVRTIRNRIFGRTDPDRISFWNQTLSILSGLQWQRYKIQTPPAAGYLRNVLTEGRCRPDEEIRHPLLLLKDALKQSEKMPWHRGAELLKRYLELAESLFSNGQKWEESEILDLQNDFRLFLAVEQTDRSAALNSELLFHPFLEKRMKD